MPFRGVLISCSCAKLHLGAFDHCGLHAFLDSVRLELRASLLNLHFRAFLLQDHDEPMRWRTAAMGLTSSGLF